MPLVGQMPASLCPPLEEKTMERPQTFTDRARETMGDAMTAVRDTFNAATEPITHAQERAEERKKCENAECFETTLCALCEQHKAALHNPNVRDKTKIHMMMDAKHNEFYVGDKGTKRLCEHSHASAQSAMAAIKHAVIGKSASEVERDALMQQHKAALANPSECDKTKFFWL